MLNNRTIKPRIAVFGVGGAGGNAINNMIAANITEIEFVAANTDMQALSSSRAHHKIQLGGSLTEGLGAGAKPEVGEAAAEAAVEEIGARIYGSHMVFIAAGMGGGTGTGAAHVIARVAKDLGVLVVAVVTKPFHFEGAIRMRNAEAGIAALRKHVDTLLVIPNENLFRVSTRSTTIAEAFVTADETLYSGLACIIDLIVKDGLIDLDFADVRTVLAGMGTAMMGMGEAAGENRAVLAAEGAIFNPLIDDVSLKGAKHVLVSITSGRDLTLWEVDEAANRVRQDVADPNANIIVGATLDESLDERMRVAIVASGMPRNVERLPAAGEGAATRSQRVTPDPVAENFGRRLAEAMGERDPGAKTRKRKSKRRAPATTTDAIAAAIAPDGVDAAGSEPMAPGRRAALGRKTAAGEEAGQPAAEKPKRATRGRRAQIDAAVPPERREFWAAQTGDAQASPHASPSPREGAPADAAPADATAQPGHPAGHDTAPPPREGQPVPEPTLARLEAAPDGQRLARRPGTREQYEKDGFRYLAERMRLADLADNDSEPAEKPVKAAAPHDARHVLPGPLVAFRGEETPPPPRESNFLQRLAGFMRPRREA